MRRNSGWDFEKIVKNVLQQFWPKAQRVTLFQIAKQVTLESGSTKTKQNQNKAFKKLRNIIISCFFPQIHFEQLNFFQICNGWRRKTFWFDGCYIQRIHRVCSSWSRHSGSGKKQSQLNKIQLILISGLRITVQIHKVRFRLST